MSVTPNHEHLASIAAGVASGILDESAAEAMVRDLIWAGLTVDAIDDAKEMSVSLLGDETPEDLENRRVILDALGMPISGLDLGDPVTRRRALDWLETIRTLFD